MSKYYQIINDLEAFRSNFCGIGTNKAKRRLNKLSLINPIAKACRLALQIEDNNILAKKYKGNHSDYAYQRKHNLIKELVILFDEQCWIYGQQKSDLPFPTHIIYFDIPDCGQISWHDSLDDVLKDYPNTWDNEPNSTLWKLQELAYNILFDADMLN